MLIPTNSVINDVTDVKDGEVAVECTICKKKFSVPAEDAKNFKPDEALVCTECGSAADKAAAINANLTAKVNDAVDTIKSALGK